jgi:hypothetical protein
VIQRRLDDAAQANVMGGVAERITTQRQTLTADAGVWTCGTSPQQTVC